MSKRLSTRVLVIDDDTAVSATIAAYLQDAGFEVVEAGSGAEGIEYIENKFPDVVVCDLKMPHVDGLHVMEAITDLGSQIPVIVISGAGLMADVVNALRLGASDFFIKPILNMEVLEHSIIGALEKSELRKENRRYREELEATVQTLKEDQKAGRSVQFKMFPNSPDNFDTIKFSHHVVPSLFLSGDFVDYYRIDDDLVGFYLADVSGHGSSSAFVTLMLKNLVDRLIRRYSNGQDQVLLSPADTLKRINEEFVGLALEKHLAMFCGVIDLRTYTLVSSGGAHLPAPVLVNGDTVQQLDSKGLPIGIFPSAVFEEQTTILRNDFQLQVFSDGVLEIMEQDTIEEKEAFLLANAGKKNHTIETLTQALNLKDQTDLPDDIALLVISGMK